MSIKNLRVKINNGKITVNFTIIRSDYEIKIYVHKDFYSLTGFKHGSKKTYFSKNNKIKDFNTFDNVAKFINKHVPHVADTDVINIIGLAINQTKIISDDTLDSFIRELTKNKSIGELSKYITNIESDEASVVVYPQSGSSMRPSFVNNGYTGIMMPCAGIEKPTNVAMSSQVLTKKQKLDTILKDIETIEILLNKVKDSARRLQAEIEEENK